jgi:hypothetical protein
MRTSQKSTSKIPPHVVAWLSAEGWTAEELSFAESSPGRLQACIDEGWGDEVRKSMQTRMRIRARMEAQKGERNREYNSKNKLQRKDSPSWFGEGINRDLFK